MFFAGLHGTPPASRWSSTTCGSFSSSTGSSWYETSCRRRRRRWQAAVRVVSRGPAITVQTQALLAPPPLGQSCQRLSRVVWSQRGPQYLSLRTAIWRSRSMWQVSMFGPISVINCLKTVSTRKYRWLTNYCNDIRAITRYGWHFLDDLS